MTVDTLFLIGQAFVLLATAAGAGLLGWYMRGLAEHERRPSGRVHPGFDEVEEDWQ